MQRKHEDTVPVFRLKPVCYQNTCEIKLVGYKDPSQKLGDEIVEINTSLDEQQLYGKYVDYITTIDNYKITGCIYRNNIVGDYIFNNDFLPVYSISIAFTKPLVNGFLFDIFIGFKLSEESKNLLKDPKKIYNARVHGEYVLKLYCDDKIFENYDSLLDLVENNILTNPDVVSKMETMNNTDFIDFFNKEIENTKKIFIDLKEGLVLPPLKSISKTAEFLRQIYKNNDLSPLFKFALDVRQENVRLKHNAPEKYEPPSKVLNIKDVENNPDMLDEYLNITQ